MAQRKPKAIVHKFKHRDLNEQIILGLRLSLLLEGADLKKQSAEIDAAIQKERLRKFHLLFAEFGIEHGDDYLPAIMELAWALAVRFVPGLQVVERRPGPGAPKTEGIASNPALLLGAIDIIRREMQIDSDKKACEFVVLSQSPDLKSARYKTLLAKRVRALANLVSKARTETARTRH